LPEAGVQILGLSGSHASVLRNWLYQYFSFWPGLLGDWTANYTAQPFVMFITYGFLHAGFGHLVANSLTLVTLGLRLIEDIGTKRFVYVYLAGQAAGAAGYAALSTQPFPMVGASGALFGLAGAILWRQFLEDVTDVPLKKTLQDLAWPIGCMIALNVVMYIALDGRLAWEAHLGGAIGGAVAIACLSRAPGKVR
jgi:membrane associated rhomboid family serine protease